MLFNGIKNTLIINTNHNRDIEKNNTGDKEKDKRNDGKYVTTNQKEMEKKINNIFHNLIMKWKENIIKITNIMLIVFFFNRIQL